jgi:hypothetical protein
MWIESWDTQQKKELGVTPTLLIHLANTNRLRPQQHVPSPTSPPPTPFLFRGHHPLLSRHPQVLFANGVGLIWNMYLSYASHSGVAPPTVTKVLNGEPNRVLNRDGDQVQETDLTVAASGEGMRAERERRGAESAQGGASSGAGAGPR